MDSIYLTKWGSYVDLSKITAVEISTDRSDWDIKIYFQLMEKPVLVYLLMCHIKIKPATTYEDFKISCLEDLVNAWKEYKKSNFKDVDFGDFMDEQVSRMFRESDNRAKNKGL